MFEDKSKINYPYEFTETITVPLKNPIDKNSRTAQVHITSQLRSTIKSKFYTLKKLIIIKISNCIDPYDNWLNKKQHLAMHSYLVSNDTIHAPFKSAVYSAFYT